MAVWPPVMSAQMASFESLLKAQMFVCMNLLVLCVNFSVTVELPALFKIGHGNCKPWLCRRVGHFELFYQPFSTPHHGVLHFPMQRHTSR